MAPVTGVVQPINNAKANAKIKRQAIKFFESASSFLLNSMDRTKNKVNPQTSSIAGYFKKLPLSKGKGLKKVLIIASGCS